MGWKFWRNMNGAKDSKGHSVRLPGIKELPSHIGMHLVVKEKLDPDWAWELRMVICRRDEDKTIFDFRVFSRKQAADAGVRVTDYHSLSTHPELILYFGHSNKTGTVFHIEKGDSLKAA
jgi:hypothetical protein